MKYAADFRQTAREALCGRWKVAVIAGLLAMLLGAVVNNGPEINFNISGNGLNFAVSVAGQEIYTSDDVMDWSFAGNSMIGATVGVITTLAAAVFFFVVGSVVEVGYARFNLDLIDRKKEPEIKTLFGYFARWGTPAVTRLLTTLYVLLWSLLLIFPGVIASYSYAMTGYILAEHPEMSAGEAISRSKEIMEGNRFRLFCLQLSFIGWAILCAFTCGIGNLWLEPYVHAATAAFYREITGTTAPIVE